MPKRLAAALAPFALALLLCSAARADELTPEKAADIKLLFQVSGSGALGGQLATAMAQQTISTIKLSRPDLNKRALDVVQQEMVRIILERMEAPGGLLDRLLPVYARTYTHAEIRELIAFYRSPVGQKAIRSSPELFREGQKIGAQMAKELAPELKLRINEALFREGVSMQGGTQPPKDSNPPRPGQ